MSDKILIRSNSEGLIVLPAVEAFGKQTIIVNGINEMDATTWNKCRGMIQHHLDAGTITELHSKAIEGKDGAVEVKSKAFADLTVPEQEQAIAQCFNGALLEEWARIPKIQQTAISIKIADQIKKLNEVPKQG